MNVRVFPRGLPSHILGLALCLWGLGALTGSGSQAQIVGPEGRPLAGPNYIVPPELGETRGPNLFHRFLVFNVHTGERVTFTGPDSIDNIVSLITGDEPSRIDGTISTEIPGANLFLLNPNGIMFGANARLNVNGSFYVSTADGVRFADGTIYTGDLGDDDSLTVEPPVAFGFGRDRSSPVSPIVIEGSNLAVPSGTLSLAGGDITITGGILSASGGIDLIGIGSLSPGDVPLDTSVLPPDFTARVGHSSTIELSQGANLNTGGNNGGRIVIRGGQLIVDQSAISSVNDGNQNGSEIGIDIDVADTPIDQRRLDHLGIPRGG